MCWLIVSGTVKICFAYFWAVVVDGSKVHQSYFVAVNFTTLQFCLQVFIGRCTNIISLKFLYSMKFLISTHACNIEKTQKIMATFWESALQKIPTKFVGVDFTWELPSSVIFFVDSVLNNFRMKPRILTHCAS